MKNIYFIVIILTIFGINISLAQETPRADKRQKQQKERIKEGVKEGELNKKEAKVLIKEQRKIKRIEARAKKDGVVTPKEKAKIEKAQDKASKNITRKKNNNQ